MQTPDQTSGLFPNPDHKAGIMGLLLSNLCKASLDRDTNLYHRLKAEEKARKAQEAALTDGLTGLRNRRAFDEDMTRAISAAKRNNEPLALLIFDLDFFKAINTHFLHTGGDTVLRLVADQVRKTLRNEDIAYRIGGEEFAVILSGKDAQDAKVVAERLREAIGENRPEMNTSDGKKATALVSASVGIHVCEDDLETVSSHSLIKGAGAALLAAKSNGRNCCALYLGPDETGQDRFMLCATRPGGPKTTQPPPQP